MRAARQCLGVVPGLVWDLSLVLGIRSHRPSRWRALPSDSGRVVQGFTSGTSQLKPRQVKFPYPCGGENRLSPRIVRPIKTSPGVSHNGKRMGRALCLPASSTLFDLSPPFPFPIVDLPILNVSRGLSVTIVDPLALDPVPETPILIIDPIPFDLPLGLPVLVIDAAALDMTSKLPIPVIDAEVIRRGA